jgi:hypothetical protein
LRNAPALLAAVLLGVLALPAHAADETVAGDPELAPFLRYPLVQESPPLSGLHFSHKLHRKKKADCTDCHESVANARTSAQSDRPAEAVCFTCHEASERENCATCHEGTPRATKRPAQELRFDHAAHLAREGVECVTCHEKAPDATSADEPLLPTMATCTKCHEHQVDMDRLNCTRCHTELPEKHAFPRDESMHGAGFVALHGAWAAGGSARCAQCHEQSFCADCHAAATRPLPPSQLMPDRVDRAFIHRGDFLSRHALEARARPVSCLNCHGESFCRDCHDSRAQALGGGPKASPHPPGFVMRGGVAFHGTEARQNPQACAACHDQGAASNCVTCHRVGGPGGNPHPPGWDRRGREEEKNRSGACVPCHAGGR